jgi:hypothetical protein
MEHFEYLEREYQEVQLALTFPFTIEDKCDLVERRRTICAAARELAAKLNIIEPDCFSEIA